MGKVKHIQPALQNSLPETGITEHLVAAIFLGIATLVSYFSSLHGTWAMDDTAIAQFATIDNVLNLKLGYRKIAYLTFLVNKWINPYDPLNYRLFNIGIHVVNALLIYCIAFKTLRLPLWADRYGRYSFPVALLSSAVFALHPINTSAVTYIVQRMSSLAAMFVMLSLVFYIFARRSEDRLRSAFFYAGAAGFICLGVFSKENAIMAVPLIFLYESVFLAGSRSGGYNRKLLTGMAALLAAAVPLLFFPGINEKLSKLLQVYINMNQPIPPYDWTATDVYWTPVQHILTGFRVLGRYLLLILVPLPGSFVFDWWGFPVSTGIVAPVSTLASMAVVIAMLLFALNRTRKMPFVSFGVLWYFIAISLETFIAVGQDLYFEHRNYLPLAGLVVGVAAQGVTFFRVELFTRRMAWGIALVVAIPLALATYQRNLVWKDSIVLWSDTTNKTRDNLRALMALGNSYLKQSDLDEAAKYYEAVVKKSDADKRVQFFNDSVYSLGMLAISKGDLEQARKVIETMDARVEDSILSSILKGSYSSARGDQDGALAQYSKVLPTSSGLNRVIILTLSGDAYTKKGLRDKALENYRQAIDLDPTFSAAYYGIAAVYLSAGKTPEAVVYLEKTLAMDPYNPLALSDLADIMMIKKEYGKSLDLARTAVSKNRSFYQPYLAMANILTVRGEEGMAEEYYSMARERGLKEYMYLFSKARAYYLKGDRLRAEELLVRISAMKDVPAKIKDTVGQSLSKR